MGLRELWLSDSCPRCLVLQNSEPLNTKPPGGAIVSVPLHPSTPPVLQAGHLAFKGSQARLPTGIAGKVTTRRRAVKTQGIHRRSSSPSTFRFLPLRYHPTFLSRLQAAKSPSSSSTTALAHSPPTKQSPHLPPHRDGAWDARRGWLWDSGQLAW